MPTGATGKVVFKTNGVAFDTGSLTSGLATRATMAALAYGETTVTAEYAGDGNYAGSTKSFVQTLTNHPPTASVMLITRTRT